MSTYLHAIKDFLAVHVPHCHCEVPLRLLLNVNYVMRISQCSSPTTEIAHYYKVQLGLELVRNLHEINLSAKMAAANPRKI